MTEETGVEIGAPVQASYVGVTLEPGSNTGLVLDQSQHTSLATLSIRTSVQDPRGETRESCDTYPRFPQQYPE